MKKIPQVNANPRKLGKDPTPGPTRPIQVRIARADRDLIAQASRLRGASASEYVRLVVLAAAKRDIAASQRTK